MTRNTLAKFGLSLLLLGWTSVGSIGPATAEDTPPAATAGEGTTVVDKSPAGELSLWNSIKDSQNADDFRTYLDNFPNGMFFDPAKDRYETLSGQKYEPAAGTDLSKTAPEPPAAIMPPAKTAKTVKATAKVKSKPVAAVKSRPKKHIAAVAARPKKQRVAAAVVHAKPAVQKKIKVASKKKACTSDNGCLIADPPPVPVRAFSGNVGGHSGGSGGGGGGGWH